MRAHKPGWLVITVLLSGCAGIGGGTPRRPATPSHIAYIDDGRLHVITSSGRVVLTYPQQPVLRLPGGPEPDCAYREPAVHPEGNRVLVLQDCQREQPPAVRIIEFTLDAPRTPLRVLYQGAGRGLQFPAWSSDGRRLAFLELGDVVACASDCQETFRTKLPRTHGAWTQLVWQPNQRRVLVRARTPKGATSIAVVNPDLGEFQWLAEQMDKAQLNGWIASSANALAVRGLFGSAANPRAPIAWSPDTRRYFYRAGNRIEGYDTQTARATRIKSLGMSLSPLSWID